MGEVGLGRPDWGHSTSGGTAHLGAQHVIAPLAGLGACLEPAGLRWGSHVQPRRKQL